MMALSQSIAAPARIRPNARILAGALLLASFRGAGPSAAALDPPTLESLEQALARVNLSIQDLSWDKRPISDPFRLSCVNEALDRPLMLAEQALRAESEFTEDPVASLMSARHWLDLPAEPAGEGTVRTDSPLAGPAPDPRGRQPVDGRTLSKNTSRKVGQTPDRASSVDGAADGGRRPGKALGERLRGAPRNAAAILGRLAAAWEEADRAREAAMSGLTNAEKRTLAVSGARLYTDESEEDWDMAPVLEAAKKVDVDALWRAARALAVAARDARAMLAATDVSRWRTRSWRFGAVTVGLGGPGADRHAETIVLDGGGDDVYDGGSLIVDLAGDDTYRSAASGFMSAALVLDLTGNDRYLGGDFVQGGAAFGVSLLVDLAGDDRYEAGQCSQGSAFFGIGMLFDQVGSDAYRGARFVQGFGGTRGLGVLSDLAGDDTYYAGGRFRHAPLLPENYQSLSQGFGFGLRGASASGGVGILADHGGNDVYSAEVFGQGASYWFALGILADSAGHDKYDLYQYGQGAGIHLSAGVLFDRQGNDAFSCNNGVAQGSGHDWGVGLLWDLAGDDYYQGSGMSQGGANANGVGMLIDRAGSDAYSGSNEKNQGDSFFARGTIGLGLLLDLGGKDRYTHGGKDGGLWTRGTVGVGYDRNEAPSTGGDDAAGRRP